MVLGIIVVFVKKRWGGKQILTKQLKKNKAGRGGGAHLGLSTWEVGVGKAEVQGLPWLLSESKVSLGCSCHCLKTKERYILSPPASKVPL